MIRPTLPRAGRRATAYAARCIHSGSPTTLYNRKYAEKLQQKAREMGLGLEELKTQAREEASCKQKEETAILLASSKKANNELPHVKTRSNSRAGASTPGIRKDSSPVKASVLLNTVARSQQCSARPPSQQPLSSILNLQRLVATPHTASQISALWTAYHTSRTKGTGRGYICASLPLDAYNAMMRVAKKYPVFVVPIPRESTSDPSTGETSGTAHEFFFLQWDFHPAPLAPSAMEPNPFEPIIPSSSCHILEPSTVLFTPLQEYKHRTSFATPYLVLTFYTDISQSHGVVLLRGEITPSSTSAAVQPGQEHSERFLLSQVDAQLLAMGLQRFYLWDDGSKDGDHDSATVALLKRFHEEPEKFSWQDLLKSSNVIT